MALIWNGNLAPIEQAGGKGYNLLRLYQAAQEPDSIFEVPKFFIIPVGECSDRGENFSQMKNEAEVREAFSQLRTPVAVRSSSVLEDSIKASFAGVFYSELDVNDYSQLLRAAGRVLDSQSDDFAFEVAQQRGATWRKGMAIIVQEQVLTPDFKGTIQMDDRIIIEGKKLQEVYREEKEFDEIIYSSFNPLGFIQKRDRSNYFGWEDYALMELAVLQAQRKLKIDFPLQAELCYTLGKKPQLVQLRQLPKIEVQSVPAEFNVPPNVPALYSTRCNGIAGEIVLPAYVTLSPSTAVLLIKHFKQQFLDEGPEREEFREKSKLFHNQDFRNYLRWVNCGFEDTIYRRANDLWQDGNKLFPEYALVCDKLDDSIVRMNKLTTNKKAIIATQDYEQISHALTVSRELGIIGMIADEDMSGLETFIHQIETGDLIHIKSDGKRGVAYLEKRREQNPYHKYTKEHK